MTYVSVPPRGVASERSLDGVLRTRLHEAPDHAAFLVRRGQGWESVSVRSFAAQVDDLAARLLNIDLPEGDRLLIVADTSYAWVVADFACWSAGFSSVPVSPTVSDEELARIVAETGARGGFAGTDEIARRMRLAFEADGRAPLPLWKLTEVERDIWSAGYAGATKAWQLESRRAHLAPEDLATVVYTPTESGRSRGVRLTHGALVQASANLQAAYADVINDDGRTVVFLPLTGIWVRTVLLACVRGGMPVALVADPVEAVGQLPTVNPTMVPVTPELVQRVEAAIRARSAESPLSWWNRRMEPRVRAAGRARAGSGSLSRWRRLEVSMWVSRFAPRFRAQVGSQLTTVLSGGTRPVGAELHEFLVGFGIDFRQAYVRTETAGAVAAGAGHQVLMTSCSHVLPGWDLRTSEDGEISVRGAGLFSGYADSEEAVLGADGWFATGDYGCLSEDGCLRLEPSPRLSTVTVVDEWTHTIARHAMVESAELVTRPHGGVQAILHLDAEGVRMWGLYLGVADLSISEALARVEVRSELSRAAWNVNTLLPKAERVVELLIVDPEQPEPVREAVGPDRRAYGPADGHA